MSQFEKIVLKVSVLTLALVGFQNCGGSFKAKNLASTALSSQVTQPPGPSIAPNPGNPLPDFTALAVSLGGFMGFMKDTVSTLTTADLQACMTPTACTGAGPSQFNLNYSCSKNGTTTSGTTAFNFDAGYCNPITSSQLVATPSIVYTSSTRTVNFSAATHTDYTGASHGGGLRVKFPITAPTINIQGIHVTTATAPVLDSTIYSTGETLIQLYSNGIGVNGGQFTITENLAKYKLNATPNNLTIAGGCSCPINGSLTGSISGSINASVTITFTPTCGAAQLSVPALNITKTLTIPGCSQ